MMPIERLSIRAVTVAIFVMIGMVASGLSLFAGNYFRQAALNAQVNSLSRVIEVATQEMLKSVRGHTFDLGMRLAHGEELLHALQNLDKPEGQARLVQLLDDPFVNGFVGFANINLEQIRVYDLGLKQVAVSAKGSAGLPDVLPPILARAITTRKGVERLKAVDALWISPQGPLHSTLVPIGGLRLMGYLEIVINPVFNLPDIGAITQTPIRIFSPSGTPILAGEERLTADHLAVEYMLAASDGTPAFKIVGYEDLARLDAEMNRTRLVTITGFLLLTFGTLLLALWLFNRFLFVPVGRMERNMARMAAGDLDLSVERSGLRDFALLADAFNAMATQVRRRSQDMERLLDLDDSAILCFGAEGEAVYLNRGALAQFGYAPEEMGDLDMGDLFDADIPGLLHEEGSVSPETGGVTVPQLTGIRKDGSRFDRAAELRSLHPQGGRGYAVMLPATQKPSDSLATEAVVNGLQRSEQRMDALEHSLNSLLELARGAAVPLTSAPGTGTADDSALTGSGQAGIREQAVNVMGQALACWERDLGKGKVDLAEESRIWPVYIDKSTPTTRTLDKYLNLETCPQNPRSQRVINTAEFVLKQLGRRTTADRKKLQQALDDFRRILSGT